MLTRLYWFKLPAHFFYLFLQCKVATTYSPSVYIGYRTYQPTGRTNLGKQSGAICTVPSLYGAGIKYHVGLEAGA